MNNDTKTSVAGGVAGVCQLVGLFVPGAHALCDPISAVAIVVLGWFTNKPTLPK